MRNKFDEELNILTREMILMGAMCEEVIVLASEAMKENNKVKAEKVAPLAVQINRKEREIESLCLGLLLKEQPVAKDLRLISAALKMVTDMERIGDQAEDVAELLEYLAPERFLSTVAGFDAKAGSIHIGDMSESTVTMVNWSIDAFVKQDTELAHKVIDFDDRVDELFVEIKNELIALIVDSPQSGEYAMDLLMIAKYYERIGDHAVNIARWVVFAATGEFEDK